MPKFVRDALDLLRFRFYPLKHYVYPAWQPLAWLLLVGIVGGLAAQEFQADILERILFFAGLNLVETMLMSTWLMVWWRWILKRPISGSLFPLVVLASSAQLFEPLIQLFPDNLAMVLALPLAIYGLCVLVAGVAAALAERRLFVVLAIMAYLPVALTLLHLATTLALNLGWIVLDVTTLPATTP